MLELKEMCFIDKIEISNIIWNKNGAVSWTDRTDLENLGFF